MRFQHDYINKWVEDRFIKKEGRDRYEITKEGDNLVDAYYVRQTCVGLIAFPFHERMVFLIEGL